MPKDPTHDPSKYADSVLVTPEGHMEYPTSYDGVLLSHHLTQK
jgi:hypothetical protein